MRKRAKGFVVLVTGIVFTITGPFISIIPLMPGWMVTATGILLLTLYFPRLRAWVDTHTVRWPQIHAFIHRIRLWAERNIGEL